MAERQHKYWTYNDKLQAVQGYFRVPGARYPRRRQLATYAELGLDAHGKPKDRRERSRQARAALLSERYDAEAERLRIRRPGVAPSMAEIFERFIADHQGRVSAGTLAYYERTRDEYLAAPGDHALYRLGGIRGDQRRYPAEQVGAFVSALKARQLSDASVNIRLQVLGKLLRWAYEADYLDRQMRVPQLRRVARTPKVPDWTAVRAYLERLTRLQDPAVTPRPDRRWQYHLHERALVVAMGTGARLGEIFHLQWAAVDLARGEVVIRADARHMVKGRRERVVPLLDFARRYLQRVRGQFPAEVWLLDDGAGNLALGSRDVLSRAFARHRDRLGLPGAWKAVHGFRAWYATEAERAGLSLQQIQGLMGHSQITTTLGYLADPEGAKRAGAQRLGAHVEAELERDWKASPQLPDRTGETGGS